MRVFVTGASGWVGSVVTKELIGAGHTVLGLARSDASAASVEANGGDVLRGSLEDVDTLRRGATECDAVIHTAFIHDFSQMAKSGAVDLAAITAMGEVLEGSGKPFVTTSGTALLAPGRVATENDKSVAGGPGSHRAASDQKTMELATRGVRAMLMRLPPSVHGAGDHGFVPRLVEIAREKGASAYIDEGTNRWPAVHRLDAARLYRLAIERGESGAAYHAIGDEGVPTREIAEAIARGLGVPAVRKSRDEAAEHFGWIAAFFGLDVPASAEITREKLGWQPDQPGLIDDLNTGSYFSR